MTFKRMPRVGSFCVKLISIFLIPTFILSGVAYAAPTVNSTKTPSQDLSVTNPESIVVPREFGLVKTKFTGKDDRLIIHIQDAHCNYEAQSNIVRILENLYKNYNVSLVSVEGADGVIDTSWFKAFPDDEVRKEVADYFMKKGEITGPEFLSITTDYNIKLFGAETRSYYIDNLNAFTSSYPLKDQTERYLNNIKSALNKLKTYIYSEDLKLMDAKYQDYESKKLAFNDYVKFLQVEAEKAKINLRAYENFFKLVSVLVYEKKIDFTVTDKERSALIDRISKVIPKEALTELVNKSLEFKTGKISSADYYSYLKKLAIDNGTDLAGDYPNLFNYIIYNSVYSRIENEKLFNDIKKLEGDIKEKLFTTDDQRMLEKLSRHIDILLGLVNIKLLNGDYEYFEKNKSEFSHEVFSDFLKKKAIQYGLAYEADNPNDAVVKALPQLEDFYSIAIKRDKALVDNTLGQMSKDKSRVAVLVTGGFHSEGMSKLLEKQGISYMVVCPSITKDLPTPYIQILTNQKTPLADILVRPVHASEGDMMPSAEALAPTLRTFVANVSPKDLDDIRKRMKGAEALIVNVGKMKNDFYSISVKGIDDKDVLIGGFQVKGYVERMRQGVGGVSSSSVLVADSVIEGLNKRFPTLNLSSEDRQRIKNIVTSALNEDESLKSRMREALDRKLAAQGRATPGTSGSSAVLTIPEAGSFGEAVAVGYGAGTVKLIVMNEVGPGFQFVTHENLVELCDERGLPTNVHPGRGGYVDGVSRGKLQAHIDRFIYEGLTQAERRTIAEHEFAHLAIFNVEEAVQQGVAESAAKAKLGVKAYSIWKAWIKAGKPAVEAQEKFVNGLNGCDVVDTGISAKIERLAAQKRLNNMRTAIVADDIAAMEKILARDRLYGSAAADEIKKIKATASTEDYARFIRNTITRRYNIDRANTTLINTPYEGYDIVIISSTTPDEAGYQQDLLEKAFNGVSTRNNDLGNKVCILSVMDESEGGQILGQVNTWLRAKEGFERWAKKNGIAYTNLDDVLDQNMARIAIYHNGGKGERFSPGSQGYGNSRGAQNFRNPVVSPAGVIDDANLILGVVMSTAPIAMSMPEERRIDTYWANQVAFGTVDLANVQRANYAFDKMVVKVPKNAKPKDLFDYGTAIIDKAGKIQKFLANKVLTKKDSATGKYVDNPDYANELAELKTSAKGSYDYGSFSMSKELHRAMVDYWINVRKNMAVIEGKGKAGLARDIDPAFVQIAVPIMSGLSGKTISGLPSVADLDAEQDNKALLDKAYSILKDAMEKDFALAVDKVYKKSKDAVLETVEMIIRYPAIFSDINNVVGSMDLGEDSHWFAFKRLLDMANNRLLMLSDMLGRNMEIEPSGNISETPLTASDAIKAEDARRMFGITESAVCVFEVNGKKMELTAEQVKKGWSGYGVEIKGSIIQGKCVLLPGSKIINSFIHDSQGLITADNSYLESSAAPSISAKNSVMLKVLDNGFVQADKEIVADVFRPDIRDSRFSDGQTRLRAPIGYDPKPADKDLASKMSDAVRFGDNVYSFKQIREMDCNRTANDVIESGARVAIQNSIARAAMKYATAKRLSFGTSGLRGIDANMTDEEIYINTRGFIEYLFSVPVENGGIRPGDTINMAEDFRPSSRPDRIPRAVAAAIIDSGCKVDNCGNIATPAVMNYGMYGPQKSASIMVTASHNPYYFKDEDKPKELKHIKGPVGYNGIKFNRPNGEILKFEEKSILSAVENVRMKEYMKPTAETLFKDDGWFKPDAFLNEYGVSFMDEVRTALAAVDNKAADAYVKRYMDAFGKVFDGEDVLVYQHTAVGRELVTRIFEGLGANVTPVGRADEKVVFKAVDTEDIKPWVYAEIKEAVKEFSEKHGGRLPFAIVTTDGDSDRPAVFYTVPKADGDFDVVYIPGNKLGILTSLFIKPDFVALTATADNAAPNALKQNAVNAEVMRTKVGSPYVNKVMIDEIAKRSSAMCVAFEGNGGYLTASDIDMGALLTGQFPDRVNSGGALKALPTRDAVLPMVSTLLMAKKAGSVERLVKSTFVGDAEGYAEAGQVENITPGCEAYTADMGKKIIASITPTVKIVSAVSFKDGSVFVEEDGKAPAAASSDMAIQMNGIIKTIKSYLGGVEGLGEIKRIEYIDGVRIYFDNESRDIVHLRPSGNAPQFRVYSEASGQERAKYLVDSRLSFMPKVIARFAVTPQAAGRATPGVYAASPTVNLTAVPDKIEPEKELQKMFEGVPESMLLRALESDINRMSNSPDRERFKEYLYLVASRALDVSNPEVARGLQIMAGQGLVKAALLEARIPGIDASKLRVTTDINDMVKATDKDRGLSYLSATSVAAAGTKIALKEGEDGLYFRGVEGLKKIGNNNILQEAIYDRNKFDDVYENDKMIQYLMVHIGGANKFHTTVFLHTKLPGSKQNLSTGPGHAQGNMQDVTVGLWGKGISYSKTGASVFATPFAADDWVSTPAGTVHSTESVGDVPLAFFDMSFGLTDFHAANQASEVGGQTAGAVAMNIPYHALAVNGKQVFVRSDDAAAPVALLGPIPASWSSLYDLYVSSNEGKINPFVPVLGQRSTGAADIMDKQDAERAAQAAKIAEMSTPIISRPTDAPVFKKYAWGGTGISRLLNVLRDKIAEIWFNSTQKDGLSKIAGSDVTLAEAIAANPEKMLGPGMSEKPIFNKILGKDETQPQIVHIGFNSKIKGNEARFVALAVRERELVVALKDSLLIRDEAQFQEYRTVYEAWVQKESAAGWSIDEVPDLSRYAVIDKTLAPMLKELRSVRRDIVSYMNEVRLEPGQVIISPVGYIHSIVGSHQGHPLSGPKAKNEAWYIVPVDGGMLYFEPQQTSNTTYSPFDFPTPIEWNKALGVPVMRKDIGKGLDKDIDELLASGEAKPTNDLEAIRIITERAFRFEATTPEDFVVNDRVLDITADYEGAVQAKVESMISGSYGVMENPPFALERISLAGKGSESPASIKDKPVKDSFHELTVVKGEVVLAFNGREEILPAGSTVFIPAAHRSAIEIRSNGEAEVLKTYPGRVMKLPAQMDAAQIAGLENALDGDTRYLYSTLRSQQARQMMASIKADGGVIINAFDTGVQDTQGPVQMAQALVEQELGSGIINIRGIGKALLASIEEEARKYQGKVRAVVTTTPDKETAAAATKYGSVVNVEQMMDQKIKYMPVPGLQNLAIRIAIANIIYKDKATKSYTREGARFVYQALDRIALAPDNKPFTINDVMDLLKKGFFRILPRIVPVNLAAAREAYIAARAALQSL